MRLFKKAVYSALFISILSVSFVNGQEYGVFIMSGADTTPAKNTAKSSGDVALPASITVDDNALPGRKTGSMVYRHQVCIEGQYVAIYDYNNPNKPKEEHNKKNLRQLESRRQVKCKYYYGPNTPAAKQKFIKDAVKEFNFYTVQSAAVTESKEVPAPQAFTADISAMKTSKADSFEEAPGVIYKLIVADSAKIKKLANYAYDQLPAKLEAVMANRPNNALPIRITVYEDYTPGATGAVAVYVFSSKEKYTQDISDLNKSGRIYDIKPDYAVKYTPGSKTESSK